MSDLSQRIQILIDLNQKATPDTWIIRENPRGNGFFVQAPRIDPTHPYDIEILGEDDTLYPTRRADADLIVALKSDALSIINDQAALILQLTEALKNSTTSLQLLGVEEPSLGAVSEDEYGYVSCSHCEGEVLDEDGNRDCEWNSDLMGEFHKEGCPVFGIVANYFSAKDLLESLDPLHDETYAIIKNSFKFAGVRETVSQLLALTDSQQDEVANSLGLFTDSFIDPTDSHLVKTKKLFLSAKSKNLVSDLSTKLYDYQS